MICTQAGLSFRPGLVRSASLRMGTVPAVGPGRSWPANLTAQHRDLVAQDEDFHVLGGGTASDEHEPAEYPYRDQVQQSEQHSPRSCRDPRGGPKRQVTEPAWS